MGLTRKRLLVAATEGTYGTSAVPIGTDAILVEDDLKISPLESTALERKVIQPYFGKRRQIVTKKHVKIEFSVELAGSGAAGTAPGFGRLLTACGFAETLVASTSATYAPVSSNSTTTSLSMAFHADGQKHLALGCRGNVKLTAKVNDIPKLQFEFMGIYSTPTDANLPTPTYSAHYITNPSLRRAIADHLQSERRAVAHEIELLAEESPYRNDGSDGEGQNAHRVDR